MKFINLYTIISAFELISITVDGQELWRGEFYKTPHEFDQREVAWLLPTKLDEEMGLEIQLKAI